MAKKKNKYLEDKIKPILKQVLKKANNDFMACARRTNKIILNDITKMYKVFIEQFYYYQTTSYVRHFEGKPGTRRGENLLYGQNFRIDNRASHSPKLYVEFSGDEMVGGYEHDSPDQVLDCVLAGIRFPYATGESGPMIENTTFEYYSKYFQYKGETIRDAFDEFERRWDKTSSDAFYSMWGEYVNKWDFTQS